ncbi:unnamed protein product [Microthlaspi erraticum]|uniref:TF-B3 domain-containing protein n=1 Tax=Microthlaspi erraticum TaxID=1685480 RepID=A0A6D2HM78_9BRAS|nr:unnamed protein product [Microthlaspi erraticum]
MATNPPLQSPTNLHFFQPLLPGSDTHITISVAFFTKHIQGNNDQKTAKLRSDASDKTWQVKIEGRTLTVGWKDFATAHDLRVGDIIVFKHEGDMVFHVTPFGPSCCEIQYSQSPIIEEEDDNNDDEDENEKKPETYLSYDYCFVAQVTASNLKWDKLNLPVEAARSNALNRRCHKMIVVNEDGKSWTLNLSFEELDKSYYMRGGWRRFCRDNRLKVGDSVMFNLVGDGKTIPMICICPKEECSELMSRETRGSKKTKKRPNWVASSSSRQNRFVTIILTRYNIQNSKLILPNAFVRINGINKHKKIILMDKHGVKRLTNVLTNGRKSRGLGKGWKDFCHANDVLKIGEPFELELIWEDAIPVLKFCSKVKIEPISVSED